MTGDVGAGLPLAPVDERLVGEAQLAAAVGLSLRYNTFVSLKLISNVLVFVSFIYCM